MDVSSVLIATGIAAAFPAGLLIAWMSRDELAYGRKWFKITFVVLLSLGIAFFLLKEYASMYASFFIMIMCLASYWKSFDKKWKRRIK